jgi:hypothetical protein
MRRLLFVVIVLSMLLAARPAAADGIVIPGPRATGPSRGAISRSRSNTTAST